MSLAESKLVKEKPVNIIPTQELCYFLTPMHFDISQNYSGWISPCWSWMTNFKRFLSFSFPHCLIQRNISFRSCRSKMMTYSLEMTWSTTGRLRARAVCELRFCVYLLGNEQQGAGPWAPHPPPSPGGVREGFVYMPEEQSHVMEILQVALLNFTFAFSSS